MKLSYGVCLTVIATATLSFAKPASPRPMVKMQADGSKITVVQRGDECFRYFSSTDGYLLLADSSGVMHYADTNGVITKVKAHNANERTADENTFLGSMDKNKPVKKYKAKLDKANQGKKKPGVAGSSLSLKKIEPTTGALETNTGVVKGIIILVQFSDVKFQVSSPQSEYTNFFNKEGYSNYGMSGSARDFWISTSDSAFLPTFDVYGPFTVSKGYASYGANENGWDVDAVSMIKEACNGLNSSIDYSKYDNDGDGTVDFVYFIYAGYGESDYSDENTLYPCSSVHGDFKLDNTTIGRFALSNERSGSASSFALDGIATFCHEFGHILGLPDLYDTDNFSATTPGNWALMDVGCYNSASTTYGNGGCTPPHLSASERYTLDWLTPTKLVTSSTSYALNELSANQAYILPSSDENEFFMLENRQQTGWDAGLPGHGMLIWHIDYDKTIWVNNSPNNTDDHQCVDIEAASGTGSGASYPGTSKVTSFTNFTTWAGTTLTPSIYNITETNGIVYFTTDKNGTITGVNNGINLASQGSLQLIANKAEMIVKASVAGDKKLCFYNLGGKLVRTEQLSAAESRVSLESLSGQGMLVARLIANGKVLTEQSVLCP